MKGKLKFAPWTIIIMLNACEMGTAEEPLNEVKIVEPEYSSSQNTSSTADLDDWVDIPVYFKPIGGLVTDRNMLSVNGSGDRVDLWNLDDNSGRQKWIIKKNGSYYHIKSMGGLSNGRVFLSSGDGTKVDLWTVDDGSGKQRWLFTNLYDDIYNIRISMTNWSRRLLSTTSDGKRVDLWTQDDLSGRQRWRIEDGGNYEMFGDIVYNNPSTPIPLPSLVDYEIISNQGPSPLTYTITLEKSYVESSSHEQTQGFTLSTKRTFTVKVPAILDYEVELGGSYTKSGKLNETVQTTQTVTRSLNYTLAPGDRIKVSLVISESRANVGYTVKMRNMETGVVKTLNGIWEGVQKTNSDITVLDLNTGRIVHTFDADNIPSNIQ